MNRRGSIGFKLSATCCTPSSAQPSSNGNSAPFFRRSAVYAIATVAASPRRPSQEIDPCTVACVGALREFVIEGIDHVRSPSMAAASWTVDGDRVAAYERAMQDRSCSCAAILPFASMVQASGEEPLFTAVQRV